MSRVATPRPRTAGKAESLLLDLLSMMSAPIPPRTLRPLLEDLRYLPGGPRRAAPLDDLLEQLVARGDVLQEKEGYRLRPSLALPRLRALTKRQDRWSLDYCVRRWLGGASRPGDEAARQLRLSVAFGNWSEVEAALRQQPDLAGASPLEFLAAQLDGLDWFDEVPQRVGEGLLHGLAWRLAVSGSDTALADWLSGESGLVAQSVRLERAILRGQLDEARILCQQPLKRVLPWWSVLLHLAQGHLGEAREAAGRCGAGQYTGTLAPSLVPMLLLGSEPAAAESRLATSPAGTSVSWVRWLVRWRTSEADEALPSLSPEERGWPALVQALCLYWAGHPLLQDCLRELPGHAQHCRRGGLNWLADQMDHLGRVAGEGARPEGLCAALKPTEGWRRILGGLRRLAEPAPATQERVVWEVDSGNPRDVLRARVQKQSKRGGWTSGRLVDWHQVRHLGCATAQDRRAGLALEDGWASHGYGGALDWAEALSILAGHPLLLDATTGGPLELVERRPALQVLRRNGHVRVAPSTVLRDVEFVLERETPQRVAFYRMDQVHRRMARLLGPGIDLPAASEEELGSILAGLAQQVAIHSDAPLEGHPLEAADSSPKILLFPEGEGLRALVRVRVLDTFLVPGVGPRVITGEGRQAERALEEEERLRNQLLEACPLLSAEVAEGAEAALELLEQLAGRPEEILWPEGGKLQVQRTLAPDDLQLRIQGDRDWFRIEGEVAVGEAEVLQLRRLLEHARSSGSRFVPLGEGRFLALTRTLQRRLVELADLTSARGSALELHPLAGLAVEEMEFGLQADGRWKERVADIRRGLALKPRVPRALQADLRDYQADGYRWLARAAPWAGGACLADDMGLGKTVQALALLLRRASEGPALVVAPTSVCSNWLQEAARFAPSLQVLPLADSDRDALLAGLGAGDLVIASYGLLVREAERLASVPWSTVILDEAQAIKNPSTRRFQAAVGLNARFRLATTGTPVENRLDELWALFGFLIPGLLGSRQRFWKRFATPIEQAGDQEAAARLQRLVRPFMLRRTKDQVLKELPSRTEVEVLVEPNLQEKALYEALRREAVERIAHSDEDSRFQVLAELMRLRRAACHPRLVLPEADFGSGKHEVFAEVLDELLAENHRVLVFSQFVDHLALVREHLEARGIAYQYLDGSTPTRERSRRVKAFQEGVGEVFLINLRAGGTGLNLTGADYVIHLDPWWNPAVEDQASDRAHRLGQTRPVTIYRLVARGTIEEKILRLHADKRKLAEGLLSGADTPGAVPVEELVRLLREA